MRNAHGYAVLTDPDIPGGVRERDTMRCNHCMRVVVLKPNESPFATCRSCMEFICEACYGDLIRGTPCKTVEQQADEIEAAIMKRRAVEAWF
jgi:hypothetical protein